MELEHLTVSAFTVPLDRARADATFAWDSTTVVVVEVGAGGGVGTGWTYGPRACALVAEDLLRPVLRNRDLVDVAGAWRAMVAAVRNAGSSGVSAMAISAVDIALWDLKARLAGIPLAQVFDQVRLQVPLYWSGGFTSYSDRELGSELGCWVRERGFERAKMKVGGTAVGRDVDRVYRAREVVGPRCELMIDANGAYNTKTALAVGNAAADLGVTWFEEPVTSDDRRSLAWLRDRLTLEVAAGEYGYDPRYLSEMAGAVDVLQIDATRCGGYTGYLRAAAAAEAQGVDISCHTAQSLHVHVACATPNLRHVEYFADHHEVDRKLFDGVPEPQAGQLAVDRSAPGHGMALKKQDAEQFQVWSPSAQAAA